MSIFTQFFQGLSKRQQIFTSSGTFTPSARLLALGGWVEVICVGGGGGGYASGTIKTGGGGAQVTRRIVQVTGNVTVTIGAGGTGGITPTQGGTTSFGSLVTAAGGLAANQYYGGANDWYTYASSAGGMSQNSLSISIPLPISGYFSVGFGGLPPFESYGIGGQGSLNTDIYNYNSTNAPANSGMGGHYGGNGGSGICIVEWWE
jgi:hypothetical protein